MPRVRTPESAAKKILDLVAKKEAKNVDDAIAKHPELANGKPLLMQATKGVTATSASRPAQSAPTPRPRGSGPVLLSR